MKNLVIKIIELYQKNISFFSRGCCRFVPTCSQYFKISVKRFGVLKGSFYGIKRILKCNPFFKPKFDPVKNNENKDST